MFSTDATSRLANTEAAATRSAHARCGFDWKINRKRIQKPIGTADWAVAQIRAREIEADGLGKDTTPVTIQRATEKFLADAVARELREPTLRKYKLLFRRLNEYFNKKGFVFISQITVDDLREFRNVWNLGPLTASKHLERLKTFFRFAVDSGWIENNPAKMLKPPKITSVAVVPFSEDEIGKILRACESYDGNRVRLKALIGLMLSSGLRIGDAVMLTRDKIFKDKNGWKVELTTAKTNTDIYCPLPNNVAEAIVALSGKHPFWTGKSNAEDCSDLHRKALARLFKQAGVKGRPHQFRHTFVKRMLLAGMPLQSVSILLGHRKVSTTERHYNRFITERQENLDQQVRKSWLRLGDTPK